MSMFVRTGASPAVGRSGSETAPMSIARPARQTIPNTNTHVQNKNELQPVLANLEAAPS